MEPIRVLLVSAVGGVDPHSGDVTYTEQLLANPPEGVAYTTYDRALRDGTLTDVGSRGALAASVRRREGPRSVARHLGAAAWRKGEAGLRRAAGAYRESLRIFQVASGVYDVIHVHVFHTRFLGPTPPLVASAAGPLEWVYRDAWGWGRSRITRAERFDDAVGRVWDAALCARRLGRASRFVAFSDYLRDWVVQRGFPGALVDVVPNYLPAPGPVPIRAPGARPAHLGFVAKDFDAKGGPLVLAAHAELRRRHPDLRLTVVGSAPRESAQDLEARGVRWLPFVPREQLLGEVLPGIDLFVYPSRFDGLPYGPMEALALGIPLVVSDYRALPEMVTGGAGRVARTGDPHAVESAVEELLDPSTWARASLAAHALFHERYSAKTQAPRLGAVYRSCLPTSSR